MFRQTFKDRQTGEARHTPSWYFAVDLPQGRRKIRGFEDRGATATLERNVRRLRDLVGADEAPDRRLEAYFERQPSRIRTRLVELGLIRDRGAEKPRTLPECLAAWENALADKGTEGHASAQRKKAELILVDRCGFRTTADLADVPRVADEISRLREGESGVSRATCAKYAQACKGFSRWASRNARASADHLAPLERPSAVSESNRRAMTPDEQERLLAAARREPRRGGLSGSARAMLYRLALGTGLRLSELLSRRVGSFRVGDPGRPPTVYLEAGSAKNRKDVAQPIPRDLVPDLRAFLSQRESPAQLVFGRRRAYRGAEILRHDLKAAQIPITTEEGTVDFHALRVTYCTDLARAGVPLAQAQKLMRHCDPKLTATIYSRFGLDEDADAMDRLSQMRAAATSSRAAQ